jgi:hypothetical protein
LNPGIDNLEIPTPKSPLSILGSLKDSSRGKELEVEIDETVEITAYKDFELLEVSQKEEKRFFSILIDHHTMRGTLNKQGQQFITPVKHVDRKFLTTFSFEELFPHKNKLFVAGDLGEGNF